MAESLYRQIADDLRRRIESGDLQPGSQLPTETELGKDYGNASRNTIRDAIRWLSNRGLVIARPGRGTFVAEKITPFLVPLTPGKQIAGDDGGEAFVAAVKGQGGKPTISEPRVEVRNAVSDLARELKVEEGDQVVIRHQERYIDNLASSLQTSFYPMEYVRAGAIDLLQAKGIGTGATAYIEKTLGMRAVGYRQRFTVRPPDSIESSFFKFAESGTVQVVVTRRTVYAEDKKPIRFTVTVYPADRNQFVIDAGETPPLDEIVREL